MPRTGTITEQRTTHYEGHVQGVGFRDTTLEIADSLAVSGYVQNLPDGRVKLVAEGISEELNQLERSVLQRLGNRIRETQQEVRPATQQFSQFEIRYA